MDKPTCASCQFFTKPTGSTTAYGLCVRFPAEVEHLETFWCGEFRRPPVADTFKEPQAAKKKLADFTRSAT
jgi:hypothetical protein